MSCVADATGSMSSETKTATTTKTTVTAPALTATIAAVRTPASASTLPLSESCDGSEVSTSRRSRQSRRRGGQFQLKRFVWMVDGKLGSGFRWSKSVEVQGAEKGWADVNCETNENGKAS